MSRATLVEIVSAPVAPDGFGWRAKFLVSYLLPDARFLEQSQLFFQRQLAPGFPNDDPDTVDPGLKLNFAAGPNIVSIGNGFGKRHLELAGYSAHNPYFRKDHFLVNAASRNRHDRKGRKGSVNNS